MTPTSTNFTFGGPADLWGTTWTVANVNGGNFIGNVTEKAVSAPGTIEVDCMSATIFFTVPGSSSDMLKVFSQTSWPGLKKPINESVISRLSGKEKLHAIGHAHPG